MRIAIPLVFLLIGCGPGTEKNQSGDSTAVAGTNGEKIVRSVYPDGKTKSEITYKDGKKNGLARTFDKNGAIILELPYVNDKREGISKRYYTGGQVVAQTTEYKDDKMHGMQTRYRGNGNVMSEARYENDFPCNDLKEYLENKSLKKKYPTINIKVEDNISSTGIYKLNISLSERVRSVKFYKGNLSSTGCVTDKLDYLLMDEATKVGEVTYHLPPGGFVMEELNIVAVYETLMGNTAIAQRRYHVAIDN